MPRNAFKIDVDTSKMEESLDGLEEYIKQVQKEVTFEQANEILRISVREVPLDTGRLQNSGVVEDLSGEIGHIIAYDTAYAAKMHENPQFNFQNGRKGKYLEDPVKRNDRTIERIARQIANERLKKRLI